MIDVSVIVPVYNPGRYLAGCLDSVLGQTLRQLEVLCVDDGSTDGSATVLDDYAARDSRVRVFHRQNSGAAASRNFALDQIAGRYISFMDSDDAYASNVVLERLVRSADAHGALICGGGLVPVDESGALKSLESRDEAWTRCYSPEGFIDAVDADFMFGFQRFLYSAKLRALRFPDYRVFEDPPFLVSALAEAGGFWGVDFDVYRYRVGYRGRAALSREKRLAALLGFADVARTGREADMPGVVVALRDLLRSDDISLVLGDRPWQDVELMRHIRRVDSLLPEAGLRRRVFLRHLKYMCRHCLGGMLRRG